MNETSSFEEILKRDGRLLYTNKGNSMLPFIREGKDLLEIEAVHGPLKRFDIPLYKRDSGQYVLHRIVKVRTDDYVICGDNRWRKEYGITDRHIIGVLTAAIREGKRVPVTNLFYRIQVRIWYLLYPLRAVFLIGRYKLRRIQKKLMKK